MKKIKIETALPDHQLEEALEKAIRGIRRRIEIKRDLRDPAMHTVYERVNSEFGRLLNSMFDQIEEVLDEAEQ